MNRRDLLKVLPLAASGASFHSLGSDDRILKKARLRTAICAYSFREALRAKTLTYDDLVRMAVDHDVDGLDLTVYWFPNTSDEFLLPLRRLAYKMAVEIYSISVRTEMCQPTAELREREVGEVKRWVDVANKLGASHIRVFGGNVPKSATEDQAAEWVVEILKRGADYSGTKGVILGLENHGGITTRAARIVQIVKQVDSPWVGINLDTGNFRQDHLAQIEMCLPHAVNVQMKTGAGGTPLDWDHIMGMLAKSGYKGYVALEYEAKENPATAVPRLLKQLRELADKHSA